jgi:hypothetical protein
MGFKYEERTQEDVSRRSKQSSGAYDSYLRLAQYKPKAGENCIRIVPWLNGERPDAKKQREDWGGTKTSGYHWGIDVLVHFQVGPDEATYLCLKMKGLDCPVCIERQQARDDDERQKLQATTRILCWLIDRDEPRAGVQLWAMPLKLSKDISKRSVLKGEGGWLPIDHPTKGYDVFYDKEGEKIKTRYERADINRDPTPLSPNADQMEDWLRYVDDNFLPDLLQFQDADYIQKVLHGALSREEGDRPRRDGAEPATREREEPIARGRRDEPESDRPRRGATEEAPRERQEAVSRGRSRDGDGSAPWEGRRSEGQGSEANETRDREAEQAQEGREAEAAKEAAPRQRFTPETDRPSREPAQETKREAVAPADDDRSSDAAKERLSRFRERRRV